MNWELIRMIENINPFPFIHKARYEMDFGLVKSKLDDVLQECREGVEKYNVPILESGGGMSTAPVSSDFQAHLLRSEFDLLRLILPCVCLLAPGQRQS